MSRVTCPNCKFTVLDAGGPGTRLGACPRCLSRGRGAVPMVEVVRGMTARRGGGRYTLAPGRADGAGAREVPLERP